MEDTFKQNYQRYQQLRSRLASGALTPAQFEAEVLQLRWKDNTGTWWTLDPASGTPLRYDGSRWIPAQSPEPMQPAQGTPPRPKGLRAMVAASPILALVPSMACGTLWFLYTFIGLFKSEGLAGLDCGTPIIIIGLPLLLWFLKKPIDKLLLPLKPVITRFPRPLRLGVALAVPLVLSCAFSTLSTSGYTALNMASLISILTAAVVMRF